MCFILFSCLAFVCNKTNCACLTMLQDLCEAAEPWRHNEFSKKDFKNELWIKLVPFIQQSEILQTTDVVVIPGSKSSTQKSASSSSSFPWTPDPITKHIAAIMEKSTDDLIVTAEKYVDETLVPLFIAGQCQEDVVEYYNRNHWQQATTEPCFCCPLLACVEPCESFANFQAWRVTCKLVKPNCQSGFVGVVPPDLNHACGPVHVRPIADILDTSDKHLSIFCPCWSL